MIKFRCSNCNKKFGVPDDYAGRRIRCNTCDQHTIVPKLTCGTACGLAAAPGCAANSDSDDDDLLTAEDLFGPKKTESRVCSSAAHAKPDDGKDIEDNTNPPADDELRLMPQEPAPPLDPEAEEIRLASIKRSQEKTEEPAEIIEFPDDSVVENPPGYWPLVFPLRGPGLGMIGIFAAGTALIIAAWFFRLYRLTRFRHRSSHHFLTVLLGGYFCWYLNLCIQTTAIGKISSPDVIAESEGDRMELFAQLARMLLTIAASLGPAILYFAWSFYTRIVAQHTTQDYLGNPILFWLLLVGGLFFLPMMLLSVILHDSATALNPILIIDSIRRTAAQYFVLVFSFFSLLGLAAIIPWLSYRVDIWFTIPASAFSIYFLMVMAAILGRFFYHNEKQLDWEV